MECYDVAIVIYTLNLNVSVPSTTYMRPPFTMLIPLVQKEHHPIWSLNSNVSYIYDLIEMNKKNAIPPLNFISHTETK